MSVLEEEFAWQLSTILINPDREYRAIEGRKFRYDFAIPSKRLLIEIQGGTWSASTMAHNSGSGIRRDCEKLNLAQLAGWRVLHFTADMVHDGSALAIVEKMIT
jgi:very-short-patch-repair endonuclease